MYEPNAVIVDYRYWRGSYAIFFSVYYFRRTTISYHSLYTI